MKLNKIQSCIACFIISLFLILPINAQQWNGVGTSGNLWRLGNVGIGFPTTPTPTLLEKLQLNGAILLGNTANNNSGTIKWTGTDFEGRTSTSWLSLTGFGGKSGNNIYNTNTGNVGIGTSNPLVKLSIAYNKMVLGGNAMVGIYTGSETVTELQSPDYSALILYGGVNGGNNQFLSMFSTPSLGMTGIMASSNGTTPRPSYGFFMGGVEKMRITYDGKVGIGTTNPSHLLTVNGEIKAKKLIVSLNGWSDFVFEKGYKLMTLKEVETAINENKHLPGMPSEKEILEKGIDVGEVQAKLLQKIEELTLYLIKQDKRIEMLEKENKNLLEKVNN